MKHLQIEDQEELHSPQLMRMMIKEVATDFNVIVVQDCPSNYRHNCHIIANKR